MATSLGTLAVNIISRTGGLVKGMRQGKKELRSFQGVANKVGRSVGSQLTGVAAGIGAAFTAGAFVQGLRNAATELDNLAKTSDKLGVMPQALAGLRHAAEQTGVSTSTMDMAMQRFTRRLAEAARGTGEAKGALAEMNVDVKSLVRLPLDQQMGVIAERMGMVGTQADRVRLAMKLFDSEGVALVNTLKLGSDGLAQMQAEARRLGIAFDRKELKKVEEFNDAFDRLSKVVKGELSQIVIDITPMAMAAVKGLGNALRMATGRKGSEGDGSGNQIGGVRGAVGRGLANAVTGDNMLSRFLGGNRTRQGAITAAERANFVGPVHDDMQRTPAEDKKYAREAASAVLSQLGFTQGLTAGQTGMGSAISKEAIGMRASLATGLMGMGIGAGQGTGSAHVEQQFRDRDRDRRIDFLRRSIDRRGEARATGNNGILERGSAAAFKALRANLNKGRDKQLDTMKDQLRVLEEQRDSLSELAKQLDFEVVG